MRTHPMTVTAAATFLVGVVLSGCSSSSDEATPAGAAGAPGELAGPRGASGTRLRAKFVAGGGARELVGFFDTARNEDCTFQRAADGRLLCLPPALQSNIGGTFGDAACKVPIAVVPACASGIRYVATIASAGCRSAAVAASLRPVLRPATTTYVQTSDGCTPQPPGAIAAGAVEVGEPVPWDQFIAAEESAATRDGLTERVAVASDGARQQLGHRIDALGADCTMQVMADGVTRCVPAAADGQLVYTDSSCSRASYTFPIGSGPCGPDGSLLREMTRSGCSATRAVYTVAVGVDAPVPDGTLYSASSSSSGASCNSIFSAASSSLRAITDITASLPAIERIGRGPGRLVPALVSSISGERLVPGFHDNEKNVDCAFAKASDGKIRCLPAGPSGIVFFTDTSCKSPARVAAHVGAVSCEGGASRFVRVEQAACTNGPARTGPEPMDGAITRVFELSGAFRNITGGSWESAPGRCSQVPNINGVADATEVDPAAFVEGTFVTE